jgi:cytochrome c peroxidase
VQEWACLYSEANEDWKGVPVPGPAGLGDLVRDRNAAIALGKALFWDTEAGSNGQACASCHFQAGADNRVKNQMNPGILGGDTSFTRPLGGGGAGGPNYT